MPEGAVRGASRHRSPGRSAIRHGAVAAGLTGSALALVGPAVIALPDQDPQGAATTLELSSQGAALAGTSSSASPAGARSAVAPVSGPGTSAAAADLIKATERDRAADAATAREVRARAAEEQRAQEAAAERERTASVTNCGASGSYGGVADAVQEVGNAMECVFPGHDVLGVGSRGGQSDHPDGYALDFMTTSGDALADCVMDNASDLGVSYVIWNQRINTGSGWESMEDRGGATANHEDHVHISFERGGSPDVSALRSCT
ncbi:hypothetical protein [Actinomycetospora straminea]|uniref:ARB-07466-like C-terminal domain-containing protein n=1 Tax=Actinomycetospora straminea TaxID=663607 RepID=A0ABP9DV83_9PSEU|nr:hypothetical protein [Actinomycetospora straminea]MDD7936276.1 hypothetical protein [Actinomycetospora straminea]